MASDDDENWEKPDFLERIDDLEARIDDLESKIDNLPSYLGREVALALVFLAIMIAVGRMFSC